MPKSICIELAFQANRPCGEHSNGSIDLLGAVEMLTAEATSQTPRKQWIQLSAEGLRQAALKAGAIGKPVLKTLSKTVPLLKGG